MSGTVLRILCLVAAVFYSAAFAASFGKKAIFAKLSAVFWIGGIAFNGLIVANNRVLNGYMPFVSMYQVLTFLGVTFAFVYVYIRYMHGGAFMRRYFIVSQAVIMVGVSCMDQNARWHFPPALQSCYFIPHVLSYMISYSLLAVAAILTVVSFGKKKEVRTAYQAGVYSLVCTAFPFMVLGMLLGALWANVCWGNYWSWDLKEAWSLVTVLSLAVYLHFRRQEKLRRYAECFVLFAFVFAVITLFFVGMFGGDSVHAYG